MKSKVVQTLPLMLSMLGTGAVYASYWCIYTSGACYTNWVNHIYESFTQPLHFFALYSIPLALVLIFVKREQFNSWLKFAVWALPLAAYYIATTHVNSNSFMDFFPYYRDDAARDSAIIYSFVSLCVIMLKYLAGRLYVRYSQSLTPAEAQNAVRDSLLVYTSYAGIISFILCVTAFFAQSIPQIALLSFDVLPKFFLLSVFFGLFGLYNSWSDIVFRFKSKTNGRPKLRFGLRLLAVNLLLVASVIVLMGYLTVRSA